MSSRQAVLSLSTTCPARLICTRSSVLRRARDVAAQLLEPLALAGIAAHGGVKAETLLVGTQRLGERGVSRHSSLHRVALIPFPLH